MKRFYCGDGIYGFRRWLYARVLWRWLPGPLKWSAHAPSLPEGWSWNVTVDGRALYARHYA